MLRDGRPDLFIHILTQMTLNPSIRLDGYQVSTKTETDIISPQKSTSFFISGLNVHHIKPVKHIFAFCINLVAFNHPFSKQINIPNFPMVKPKHQASNHHLNLEVYVSAQIFLLNTPSLYQSISVYMYIS